MHRHELDPLSLVAGLVFVMIAGGYTLTHTTTLRLHPIVLVPSVLVVIGAGVIGIVVRRMTRQAGAATPAAASATDPDPEQEPLPDLLAE